MSDLKRGEALVIFLAVGFVLFALVALGAVLYECIKLYCSRITKHKVNRQWKKRQLSLCNFEALQRPSFTSTTAGVHLPPDDHLTTGNNVDERDDEQDAEVIANNDTSPPNADEIRVVFHAESVDT